MIFIQRRPINQFVFTMLLVMIITTFAFGLPAKFGNSIVTKNRNQLDNLFLPFTSLKKVTLRHSRNFVLSRCIELDLYTLDPAKKGVTMLIIPPDPIHPELKAGKKEPSLINYQARNVSVTTVLIEIAKQAKHDLYLTSAGVISAL
mgnify:CR=1 FL=1